MAVGLKNDLWILARELAECLAASPEVEALRRSEDALLADEEAVDLVRRYEAAKRAVKMSRDRPPAEQERLIEAFMAIEDAWNQHPLIQACWQARQALDQLMERLNAVITFPITGTEAPPERKGGCGSGGGCGCGG